MKCVTLGAPSRENFCAAFRASRQRHHDAQNSGGFWTGGPASIGRTSQLGTRTMPKPSPIETDPRWDAVVACNAGCDGTFVYAVKTTGIYCRPGCPSRRRAKPENVVFYGAGAEAARAGFRACKGCRPQ
jgi:hypothetical protein